MTPRLMDYVDFPMLAIFFAVEDFYWFSHRIKKRLN